LTRPPPAEQSLFTETAGVWTVIATVAEPPGASVPTRQLTVRVAASYEHDPCDAVADTNVEPGAGSEASVSTMLTAVADDGPAFVATIV